MFGLRFETFRVLTSGAARSHVPSRSMKEPLCPCSHVESELSVTAITRPRLHKGKMSMARCCSQGYCKVNKIMFTVLSYTQFAIRNKNQIQVTWSHFSIFVLEDSRPWILWWIFLSLCLPSMLYFCGDYWLNRDFFYPKTVSTVLCKIMYYLDI
jgi:hypothetical protein